MSVEYKDSLKGWWIFWQFGTLRSKILRFFSKKKFFFILEIFKNFFFFKFLIKVAKKCQPLTLNDIPVFNSIPSKDDEMCHWKWYSRSNWGISCQRRKHLNCLRATQTNVLDENDIQLTPFIKLRRSKFLLPI